MQFTAKDNESEEKVWALIMNNLDPVVRDKASASTSSFFKTADGIECNVRRANGSLVATCYSESDRMGNRRWTVSLKENE